MAIHETLFIWAWPSLRVLILNLTIVFFKFHPKIYQVKVFLVLNLRIFIFAGNFPLRKTWGISDADFKYDNDLLKFQRKNTQKSHLCCKCKHCYFCMKLRILKNLRVLALKMAIVFSNRCLKIPTYNIFWEESIQKLFLFTWNFVWT